MDLTYVTGNYGKYMSVKDKFDKYGLEIKYADIELEEPYTEDIEFISHEKARLAYLDVKAPVFVVDCGFYIEGYPNKPGYPGALVKRSGVSTNIDELLEVMKDVDNRNCYFLDCLTYYDGENYYTFYGRSNGVLTREKKGIISKRAKSNLWLVYIPDGYSKTLAEMTEDEIKMKVSKDSVTEKFIQWYKENINQKKYIK